MIRFRALVPVLALALLTACGGGTDPAAAVPKCVDIDADPSPAELKQLGDPLELVLTKDGETVRVSVPATPEGFDIQPAMSRVIDGWTPVQLCGRTSP
jgi:hypothetical protein